MKKLIITALACCSLWATVTAQQYKNELSVSWLPVTFDGESVVGLQASYFRQLRPWYHVGVSVFRFGSEYSYSYDSGSGSYGDYFYGLNLMHRFSTSERGVVGAVSQIGLSFYTNRYFSENIRFVPGIPVSRSRFESRDKVGGNIFNVGVFVKPTKRLKLTAGMNIYTSWVLIDTTTTYFEFTGMAGCFDLGAAWRF
jgi:hypothetical protein